ncbi:hypothetical protein Tsubulata_038855 [Turnera subulata]|uniref:Uncharacterized protein n=1 Tax=Turnera subulata TaxID=218843 RepID=A0A9Q0JCY7_9ROSI|nr:hypothetical protein Tsubulata_038855 [Turnera subulata]
MKPKMHAVIDFICRQKRKLDEMYDQLRTEYESMKRSSIQPASNFYSRKEPDLFSDPTGGLMDRADPIRKVYGTRFHGSKASLHIFAQVSPKAVDLFSADWLVFNPPTPGPREDIWPARQNSSNSCDPFDISGGSPAKQPAIPGDAANRRSGAAHNAFGTGTGNPSMILRNLILSPIKRPQQSRSRPQMFQ